MGSPSDRHPVADLYVLRYDGPASNAKLAVALDRDPGVVIVAEGLATFALSGV
jgi:hypothetical protein